ncbi:MAG: hypothetical protein YYHSYBAR_002065 [Candidatus Fervidibacter sacchari]
MAHRFNPFRPHCAPALDKASGCGGITTFGGEDYPRVIRLGWARNFRTRDGIHRVANRKRMVALNGGTYRSRMFADFKAEATATLGRVPASAN